MTLTEKQRKGLELAVQRYKAGEKYTVIAGYAGTGKSTLVKFIIKALGIDQNEVAYAAFTGKAAEVLRQKGNPNACTLHHLLYEFYPQKNGGFYRKPKDDLPFDVVVVDEISMASKELIEQLFKYPIYVLCLGDPFQLPQIDKDADNHLLDNPHIFLDEIMRQAAESEIIQLSMAIRENKKIMPFKGKEVQIYHKNELIDGMLTWADQVLVAKNSTRIELNNKIREMNNRGPEPEEGDKVICLRNYWDDTSVQENALVNGTIGYIKDLKKRTIYIPSFCNTKAKTMESLDIELATPEGDLFHDISTDYEMYFSGEVCIDWQDSFKINKKKQIVGDIIPREFSYGYALTYWKAQGSEWDKVLVIEENFPYNPTEHARALYTAVTRASKKLVLILED